MVNISSEGESDGEEESDTRVKIGDITLTNEDKRIILEGKWLNDEIVHAAQLLMENDPDLLPVGSLQNPILSQAYAFDIVSGECVQILHSGKNLIVNFDLLQYYYDIIFLQMENMHWVTISTVGQPHLCVKVYDSLYNKLPFETKDQVAALMHTEEILSS